MSNLDSLLKQLFKEHLEEKAKTVNDAQNLNLALYVSDGNIKRIFLYDPDVASDFISTITGEGSRTIAYQKIFDFLKIWISQYKKLLDVKHDFIYEKGMVKRIVNIEAIIKQPERRNETSKAFQDLVLNRYNELIRVHGMLKKHILLQPATNDRLREIVAWDNGWNTLLSIKDYIDGLQDATELQAKSLLDAAYGTMQWSNSPKCGKDTMEVKSVASERGWGPLLYDIVMSIINPLWLIADRGSVSDAAYNVWEYYFYRRSDVEQEIIPELASDKCSLPAFSDNSELEKRWRDIRKSIMQNDVQDKDLEEMFADEPMAWRYRLRSTIDYQSLIDNHKKFMKNQSIKIDESQYDRTANIYFNSRYDD